MLFLTFIISFGDSESWSISVLIPAMVFTKDLLTSMDVWYFSDANFVKTGMPSPPHGTGSATVLLSNGVIGHPIKSGMNFSLISMSRGCKYWSSPSIVLMKYIILCPTPRVNAAQAACGWDWSKSDHLLIIFAHSSTKLSRTKENRDHLVQKSWHRDN